jgi:hypothetical protein
MLVKGLSSFYQLFNLIPILEDKVYENNINMINSVKTNLLEHGIVLNDILYNSYHIDTIKELHKHITFHNLNKYQLNSTFHKSWKKIQSAPYFQLVVEQLLHYFSTYGLESLGYKYDESLVYIPTEKLELKDTDINEIIVKHIDIVDKEKAVNIFNDYVNKGIGLDAYTLNHLKNIFDLFYEYNLISQDYMTNNRQLNTYIDKKLNRLPNEPEDMLRYIVYGLTKESQIVKSKRFLRRIINVLSTRVDMTNDVIKWIRHIPERRWAEIFYRYKTIFLTIKQHVPQLKSDINKIRKLAYKYHKPIKPRIVDDLFTFVRNTTVTFDVIDKEVRDTSIFKLIKIHNAARIRYHILKNNLKDFPGLYFIRNGLLYMDTNGYNLGGLDLQGIEDILKFTSSVIVDRLRPKIKGKNILMTKGFEYAVPISDKQFIGNIPYGSKFRYQVDYNPIVGIHWMDQYDNDNDYRIDLDLSYIDLQGTKLGWDNYYRKSDDDGKYNLFSGDMTCAPKPFGATEYIYIQSKKQNRYSINVNFFNDSIRYDMLKDDELYKFSFILGQKQEFEKSSSFNINNSQLINKEEVMIEIPLYFGKYDKPQLTVGIFDKDLTNSCSFYFTSLSISHSITSFANDLSINLIDSLKTLYDNYLIFNNLFEHFGNNVYYSEDEVPENIDIDYDLRIEKLDKKVLLDLLDA